ncbi:MAG: hypothetical protein J0J01_19825 [Reyranella sp.]|uniref:hypothetical protein n=1 Tax=Reyranella sp. TaxID=1929291 RepID=UPI001AD0C822|nr:hypothetical protein [Reyranella sp.]MBN9089161.1 hypothetical protein [Reyranella sp.]
MIAPALCGRPATDDAFAAEIGWHKLRASPEVTLRLATDADCIALAATLRAVDVAQIAATGEATPLEAMRRSLAGSSHAVTALTSDGRVICIFGVGGAGFLSLAACPWLFGSDLIDARWRLFARLSRKYLVAMLDLYPWLSGYVAAQHWSAIRWLEWLGFHVGRAQPIGRNGKTLRPFNLRK